MKRIVKYLSMGCFVIILLSVLYTIIMTVAFIIPTGGKIKEHLGESLFTLQGEPRDSFFDDAKFYWNDTFSDMIWLNITATKTNNSAFYDACYMPYVESVEQYYPDDPTYGNLINALYYPDSEGSVTKSYSRYWMLEVAFWKILFIFYEIKEVRVLLYFLATALASICLYLVGKELGWRGFLSLSLAMVMRMWLMNSVGLSIGIDIFISLIAMIITVICYKKTWFINCNYIFYLILGSLAYAVGPMVAPLLTLAMPLLLQILLVNKDDKDKDSWVLILTNSVQWVIGYATSIASKAFLAKMVIGQQDARGEALYYLGIGQGLGQRLNRIVYCLDHLMSPINVKAPLLTILLLIIVVIGIKRGWCKYSSFWQVFFIGLYPFVWVFIIVEHSIHNFVTNIFSIFICAFVSLIVFSIKDKQNV